MPRPSLLSPAVLVLVSNLAAQAPAFVQRPIEDVLPAGTYACASFAGVESCAAAVAGMDVAKLMRTFVAQLPPETYARHLGGSLDQAAQMVRAQLGQAGIPASTLRSVLRRPMAVGMGRVTLRGMGPSVALVIDEGDAGADIDQLVTALVHMAKSVDGDFHSGTRKVGDREVKTLEHSGFEAPPVLFAHLPGLFVATNSEGYLREIAATAAGKQPALAQQSVLGGQRARLGGPALASVFMNTDRVLRMFDDHLPYEASEIGDALGIRSFAGVYAAVGQQRGGSSETIDLAVPGAANGVLKAALAGHADLAAAGMCGKDNLLFGSMHCSVPAAVDAFQRFLDLLPEQVRDEARSEIGRDLARGMQRAGITPQQIEELLRALGGSISVAVSGLPLPEVLVFLPVRDAAAVAPWLEQLTSTVTRETGVEWKLRKVGDHEVRCCDVQLPGMSLSPSMVQAHGYLILGSHTKGVVAALKQQEAAESSLLTNDDFSLAAKAHAGAAGFLHLRPFRAAEIGWRTFETMVLPQLDAHAEEMGFGREAIPEQEAFVKGLGTMTLSLTVDDDGVRLRSSGAIGVGGVIAAFATLFDEVLARASGKVY